MPNPLKTIARRVARHKYLWTMAAFIVLVGFVDPNSFWQYYKMRQRNDGLRAEIRQYEESYTQSTRELKALSSSQKALERVARVNLYMRTADEDVYVIEE